MKSKTQYPHFELVVIGCSAGGIDALKALLISLKKGFNFSVIVVQHIGALGQTTLADFFQTFCEAPVKEAEDKETLAKGMIYFAPTGYHLLVEPDRSFALSVEGPVQFARPSIDVLMESVACVYKDLAAGFILTGANSDGAEGLKQMKNAGAFVGVQNPQSAEYPQMPLAAIEATQTVSILSLSEIQHLIAGLE